MRYEGGVEGRRHESFVDPRFDGDPSEDVGAKLNVMLVCLVETPRGDENRVLAYSCMALSDEAQRRRNLRGKRSDAPGGTSACEIRGSQQPNLKYIPTVGQLGSTG